ncbi:MAG: carboxypeptidase-like regulatory domain-containing protein [Pirellula sp.]|jgi:hypothetical protein|nr:carboxypeptidase-like regulatory domain-containing protein [Pirellula sp.]
MIRFFAFVACIPLFIGCGPSDGRLSVSGTVTLKGQNLDQGTIEFFNEQTRTGAPIADGKYNIERDQGLTPGTYKVSITSGDGRTPADDPEAAPGPTGANIVSKERIPPEFNVKTKQEAKVESGKSNQFDFAIP